MTLDATNCTGGNLSLCQVHSIPNAVDAVHMWEVVVLSVVFIAIGIIGLVGNVVMIVVVMSDRKMRHSATNLFLVNMAIADLLLMTFTIPEIVMFMKNRGWILGLYVCKIERFILVFAVYASVLTQVSLSTERWVHKLQYSKLHLTTVQ